MPLRKTIEAITNLAASGVLEEYAIAGAVAALNYIQPTLTEDLDILVSLRGFEQRGSGLLLLTPIEAALARLGYAERTDVGILIEGWPVQFLPAASALDDEGLVQAIEIDISMGDEEPVMARALKLGRLKDLARVEAFLDQDAVDLGKLKEVLLRHDLLPAWKSFLSKSGKPDILA